jgi:Transposase IS4
LDNAGEKLRARLWQLICKEELWAYFGVLIYIGLIHKSSIKDYWGSLDTTSLEYIIKKYISWTRFKQLNCYFECTEPWPDCDSILRSVFNSVNKLTKYIRLTYRKLYRPGTRLIVNETIKRFMGRAPEIINIPTKPTPKGFKIWVLANEGYILNWLWHARGNKAGLVNLDKTFTEEGFSKT